MVKNFDDYTVLASKVSREIVDKCFNLLDGELLPFSPPQRYNDDIKTILELCEITRMVSVLDPLTRTEKKVPIHTIATSHMAGEHLSGIFIRKLRTPILLHRLPVTQRVVKHLVDIEKLIQK